MNWQLDQNKIFNYHIYRFSLIPLVKDVILDGQPITCASHAFLLSFLTILPICFILVKLSVWIF
jgi:hypothetical protein